MILSGIHELHRAAVQGFDDHAMPFVLGADPGVQIGRDPLSDCLKKLQFHTATGLAVCPGVGTGPGKIRVITPCLNKTDGLGARCVGFQNLRQPRPENHDVAVVAQAY